MTKFYYTSSLMFDDLALRPTWQFTTQSIDFAKS
ncbi:hypothetical protein CCACVL1_12052, partial [Corchorus capsularis]